MEYYNIIDIIGEKHEIVLEPGYNDRNESLEEAISSQLEIKKGTFLIKSIDDINNYELIAAKEVFISDYKETIIVPIIFEQAVQEIRRRYDLEDFNKPIYFHGSDKKMFITHISKIEAKKIIEEKNISISIEENISSYTNLRLLEIAGGNQFDNLTKEILLMADEPEIASLFWGRYKGNLENIPICNFKKFYTLLMESKERSRNKTYPFSFYVSGAEQLSFIMDFENNGIEDVVILHSIKECPRYGEEEYDFEAGFFDFNRSEAEIIVYIKKSKTMEALFNRVKSYPYCMSELLDFIKNDKELLKECIETNEVFKYFYESFEDVYFGLISEQ